MANAILVKPLALGSVSAGSSAAGTSPGYLDNDYIGIVHRGTSTSTDNVDVDFGSAVTIDSAAFLSMSIAAGAQYQVGAATSAGGLVSPAFSTSAAALSAGSIMPTSGRTNSFTDLGTSQTYRYWRLAMASLGGQAFEAGRLVMGQKLSTLFNYSYGAQRGAKDMGGVDWTKDGVPLIRKGRILRTLNLSYPAMTRTEVEDAMLPLLEQLGNTRWLLAIINPSADSHFQSRMYFGPLQGDLSVAHARPGGYEAKAQLISVI